MTIPRKSHNHEAQSSRNGDEEQIMTKQTNATYETIDAINNKKMQQRNRLRMASKKTAWAGRCGVETGRGGVGWGLKPVSLAPNLTLNYGVAPDHN